VEVQTKGMHGRAAANDPAVLLATTEGVKEAKREGV
jgi:hypothetical protein